jgi:hypothetical protein
MKTEKLSSENETANGVNTLLAVRLIANFMGWINSPYDNLPNKVYSKDLTEGKQLEHFNYAESWDELMPVYRKIRDIINERSKYDKHTRTNYDLLELDVQMAICEVNIKNAFDSTVKFIECWNASKADR